jgi:hypothetical protein
MSEAMYAATMGPSVLVTCFQISEVENASFCVKILDRGAEILYLGKMLSVERRILRSKST